MKFRPSRRTLLKAGVGSLALPFLPSLSRGQEAAPRPMRLAVFFHPNGTVAEHFWPTQALSETEFDLGSILQPFAPFKDRLLLARGIHNTVAMDPVNNGGPHQRGIGALFTGEMLLEGAFVDGCGSAAGWANGPSIDQIVAKEIGQGTVFSSLELGVRANVQDVQGRISYAGPDAPLPATNDPVALYERLFFRDTPLDPKQAEEGTQAVLDAVKDQLSQVKKTVGREDRETLDHHLSLIEDLERRLLAMNSCEAPSVPDTMEVDSEQTMPQISRAHLDLLAHAFSCDLTRVASVQYSTGFNQIRYPWLDTEGEGHALSHSGDSSTAAWDTFAARVQWQAQEIAYFMDRLAQIPDGDQTVLDNTLILWATEISRGNSHSHEDIPYVLLGNAQGRINSGRYLTYNAASSCDYLHAVVAALGIENASFGHPEHTKGVLSGILK